MAWSPEEKDAVKQLWFVDGWSAGQIGRKLGKTRNAVLGVIHRCGLQRVGAKPGARPSTGPKDNAVPMARLVPKAKQLEELRLIAGTLEPIGPMDEFPATSNACRFIYGEPGRSVWQCCGHPAKPGRSWCEVHLPVVFDKVRTEAANARYKARAEQNIDMRQFNGRHFKGPYNQSIWNPTDETAA